MRAFRLAAGRRLGEVHASEGAKTERADAQEAHYRVVVDDDDRIMVLMCHNTDLADGWEWVGEDERYDREKARSGRKMGPATPSKADSDPQILRRSRHFNSTLFDDGSRGSREDRRRLIGPSRGEFSVHFRSLPGVTRVCGFRVRRTDDGEQRRSSPDVAQTIGEQRRRRRRSCGIARIAYAAPVHRAK